ncbi:MAG: methionyl-tRNA formyltransferase [Thermoguttaceae bacterium]|nr:methionyl-tRNA formyltransferase [Planctomycetaceae bacterium]MBQ4142512.1 methionyl-tRNA formyltransferase [Thermoguttaceae bacterium]
MRIVVMETGSFGVPTVKLLYESRHEIAALVTQPKTENKTRREPLPEPEIVQLAEAHGTPILRFPKIKDPEAVAALRELNADIFFICDYGQILSPEGIQAARLGGINLHGSILPKYRGSAPVQWTILNGDAEAGATVIHITPEVDAGPMLSIVRTPVGENETADVLEARLAELGAPEVLRAIDALEKDPDHLAAAVIQDASQACGAPKIRKQMAQIDWSLSAEEIRNRVRAFEPWPRTFTTWQKSEKKPPMRLILLPVPELLAMEVPAGTVPGTVLAVGETLAVATGNGVLAIRQLQPAGKKPQSVFDFLCGNAIQVGDVLK